MTKQYHTISTEAARELILSQRINGRGCMFSIAWERRTTSSDKKRLRDHLEVVTGRFNVRKHLRGYRGDAKGQYSDAPIAGRYSSAAYDRHEKGVFCLFAVSRKYQGKHERVGGYRSIPFDRLRWLKLDGRVYKVGAPPPAQH